jgi:small conductance mechanosensitive channel
VDFVFGIGYDDDLKLAKQTLQEIIDADERVLKEPESFIGVGELGDSSVNFTVRVW